MVTIFTVSAVNNLLVCMFYYGSLKRITRVSDTNYGPEGHGLVAKEPLS